MKITLDLTEDQADKLLNEIGSIEDCGPGTSTWKSDEWEGIVGIVTQAIEDAKGRPMRIEFVSLDEALNHTIEGTFYPS